MNPLSVTAQLAARAGKNLAYNLQFVPADKLGWKPAPGAKSAIEIVNHLAYFQVGMAGVARGAGWQEPQFQPATDLQSAQDLVIRTTGAFAEAIGSLTEAQLHDKVTLPFGTFMLVQAASMATFDICHHHGQIAYIQCLLGDTADHFDMAAVQ